MHPKSVRFESLAFPARADDPGGRQDDDNDGADDDEPDAGHVSPSFVIFQKMFHPAAATTVLGVAAASAVDLRPEKSFVVFFCRRVAVDVVLFPKNMSFKILLFPLKYIQ